jgi:hypothetical protein
VAASTIVGVERPRDPFEFVIGLREDVAGLRAAAAHTSSDLAEVKQDIRRVDDRVFQVLLVQIATLAAVVGSLVAAVLR